MASSYVLLGCAVFCEALWAVMLRVSNGLCMSWASGVTALAYVGSLACLSLACRGLAVSLAYPIWTGLGGALAVLIGVLWFKEPLGAMKLIGVALVLTGVMVLHGFGGTAASPRP